MDEKKPESPVTPPYMNSMEAAGKKLCGLCAYKVPGRAWECTCNSGPGPGVFECPANGGLCTGFLKKPRVQKSPQTKPARLTIPAGVRFLYIGRPSGEMKKGGLAHHGVMTVAYRINQVSHEVEIGYAFCSPLDIWNKDRGRSIALIRLATGDVKIRAPYLYHPRRVVGEIAQALMTHDFQTAAQVCRAFPSSFVRSHIPTWTKDLAKRLMGGTEKERRGILIHCARENRTLSRRISEARSQGIVEHLRGLGVTFYDEPGPLRLDKVIRQGRPSRPSPLEILYKMKADIAKVEVKGQGGKG